MAYATAAPDAEPLFFINVNLKLAPYGRRAARDGLKILEHIRFTNVLPEKIRFAPMVMYSFEPGYQLLHRGAGGGNRDVRPAGNLQHRSGRAVHQ